MTNFWKPGEPATTDRSGYLAAAVCRRGHTFSRSLKERLAEPGMCIQCGADVLVECGDCGLRIRGEYDVPGVVGFGANYSPPMFCDGCGTPHPWAGRQARIYQMENLLDEEDIDEADRLLVQEHLRRLQALDPDEDVEAERKLWQAVKKRAPGLLNGAGQKIAVTIIDRAIRQQLGM